MSSSKSVEKNIILKSTTDSKKYESPFKIFALLKKQKEQKKKEEQEGENPLDILISNLTTDIKTLRTIDYSDEKNLNKIYLQKEKQCKLNNRKIAFEEVIEYALKKNKKSENDILILKLFFMHMEKFISLLLPLKVNLNDLLIKLLYKMKCDKKNRDTILFRAGDIGQKLYILIKGSVGILIKKDKIIECTPFEFIKYLIVLHLFQEDNFMNEIIARNKNIINIEEETITNLIQIFKIFFFLKNNNRLKEDYKTIFDFAQNDLKFIKFFESKYNYSPMIALDILNFSKHGVEQLYEFYSRKIAFLNKNLKLGLRGSDYFASFLKKQMNDTGIFKPTSQQELLTFLKPYDEGKKQFKNDEEYFLKILSVYEISPNKVNKTTVEKYIKNLEPEKIINDIRIDEESIKYKIKDKEKIIQNPVFVKTFFFYEINQLHDGSIFGELALTNLNSKRTATIITKSDCFFGTIIKQTYDLSFRAAQEKSRLRNISFFLKSPIFKGINQGIFLNKFYYRFKKKTLRCGDVVYKRGKERNFVIFIIRGELEIKTTMTLKEMEDLIKLFGGVLDEKYILNLINTYQEFKKYYLNHKHNIKLCVLKDKEIAGFDDMVIDGLNMFDCVCSSSDKSEIYELDYSLIREGKKFEQLITNINSFVNIKRNLFIKFLLEFRNTIIINEMSKIRKNRKDLDEPKKSVLEIAKNNKILNTSRDDITNNKIILSYAQRQKEEYQINNNKMKSKSLIKYDKEKNIKAENYIINLTNSNSNDKEPKVIFNKKEEDIDQILTSFKYKREYQFMINRKITTKSFNKNEIKKSDKDDNKNKINNHLKIKKLFFSRNPMLLDDFIPNSSRNGLINKTFKPILKNVCLYRTRKNIIPFSRNSGLKNKKGSFTSFKMKEYQKLFTENRNKLYVNNFYIQRQKIFDLLLDKDNDDITKDIKEIQPSYSYKMKISNTQTNCSTQVKDHFNLSIKNKLDNDINISKIAQTKIEKNTKNKVRNKEGFIDFLCLDNWEEKENFKKKYLSEYNNNK